MKNEKQNFYFNFSLLLFFIIEKNIFYSKTKFGKIKFTL